MCVECEDNRTKKTRERIEVEAAEHRMVAEAKQKRQRQILWQEFEVFDTEGCSLGRYLVALLVGLTAALTPGVKSDTEPVVRKIGVSMGLLVSLF